MDSQITNKEILELMEKRGLTLEKVIDTIVDANGLIGVGLVTLGQTAYIYTMYNKKLRKKGITQEEVNEIITKSRRTNFN